MLNVLMTLTTPDNTGASRVAFEYGRAIVNSGGRCSIVHGNEPAGAGSERKSLVAEFREAGIGTQHLPLMNDPRGVVAQKWISDIGRRIGANVIVGHNQRDRSSAVFAAKMLDIPSVVCGHNEHKFRGPKANAFLKEQLYTQAMRKADLIICSGQRVLDEYVNWFGVDPSRCVLMPHGIDLERFDQIDIAAAQQLRSRMGFGQADFVMVNIGRLDRQKGQDILIAALGHTTADNVHCLLVGEAAAGVKESEQFAGEVTRSATEAGHRVRMLGWRDDYDLLIKASDAYVHSARWEGLPLVVLGALASAAPVVIPANSSQPPGFEAGIHGIAVAPDDSLALARGIDEMVALSSDARRRLGEQGRDLIKSRYDMRVISERFVGMVTDVVASAKSA